MDTHDKHIFTISTAQNILQNYLIKKLKEKGLKITPAHSSILFILEQKSPRTMTELSQSLHLDNSTITGIIDRLEKTGMVQRTEFDGDRRKWNISITEQGLAEIDKAKHIITKINREISAGFSQEDMATAHRVLWSIIKKFK